MDLDPGPVPDPDPTRDLDPTLNRENSNFFCKWFKLITMFFVVVIYSLLFMYIKQNN